jgi:hypothetical protein
VKTKSIVVISYIYIAIYVTDVLPRQARDRDWRQTVRLRETVRQRERDR